MKSAIAASSPFRSGHRSRRMALFFKVELSASAHILLQFWRVVSRERRERRWFAPRHERGETAGLAIVLFDEGVAFAGERFEVLTIQNPHRAASVFDYAFSLKHAGRHSDAWPVRAQHRGEEVVRDWDNS